MIVFTHVPKTSGTSFRKCLIEPNVPDERIYRYHGLRPLARERRPGRAFVYGHIPYGIHHLLGREARYVTFLRDPIDRAVSYYYFVKDSDPAIYVHPARADAEAHTLVDFYRLRRYQNWQARFIAGLTHHYLYRRLPAGALDRLVLRGAVANLLGRYRCFGLQERFDESLDLFQERLALPRRRSVAPQKKTGTRPRLGAIDASTRAALRDSNRLDCELYEIARERFEEQL